MPLPLTAGVKLLGVDITKQLTSTLKGLPLVGGLLAKNKDPGRMAYADGLYARAAKGDRAAYLELQQRSGIGPNGESVPGWATAKARDYGKSLLAQLEGAGVTVQTLPPAKVLPEFTFPPDWGNSITTSLPAPVKEAAEKVAAAVGTTSATVTWIALALGLVVVVKSLRK